MDFPSDRTSAARGLAILLALFASCLIAACRRPGPLDPDQGEHHGADPGGEARIEAR